MDFSLFATASLLTGSFCAAQSATPPTTDNSKPKLQFLRQSEDWSQFRAGSESDAFDRLKHIDLSEDGDVWLSLGANVDLRFEAWDGFGFGATSPGNSETFLLSRALFHADLHAGDQFRVFVQGKAADLTERDLPGGARGLDRDTLALQQAFFDWNIALDGANLRLRIGRQMLLFGVQRLISPLPWANTLRTWDGVTVEYTKGPWSVQGFATYFVPVDRHEFNSSDDDRQLYGLYVTRKPDEGGRGLDLYAIGNTRPRININGTVGRERRHTLGLRNWGPLPIGSGFDAEFEGAYQFGEVGSGSVDAYSLTGVLGYRLADWRWKPRFFVGVDVASGDSRSGGAVGTFHQIFPLGHAYFGLADIIARQNVFAVNAGANLKLAKTTKATIAAHAFRLLDNDDALYGVGGGPARTGLSNRDVAQEIDLVVSHGLSPRLRLYGGYSHVFAGGGINASGPREDQDFFYLGMSDAF